MKTYIIDPLLIRKTKELNSSNIHDEDQVFSQIFPKDLILSMGGVSVDMSQPDVIVLDWSCKHAPV